MRLELCYTAVYVMESHCFSSVSLASFSVSRAAISKSVLSLTSSSFVGSSSDSSNISVASFIQVRPFRMSLFTCPSPLVLVLAQNSQLLLLSLQVPCFPFRRRS